MIRATFSSPRSIITVGVFSATLILRDAKRVAALSIHFLPGLAGLVMQRTIAACGRQIDAQKTARSSRIPVALGTFRVTKRG